MIPAVKQLLADFDRFGKKQPLWLQKIRHEAASRFAEQGFPKSDEEEWHYTSLEPFSGQTFTIAETPEKIPEDLPLLYPLETPNLVFVNGNYSSSSVGNLPIEIMPLQDAIEQKPDLVRESLGRPAQPFVSLNTAFLKAGVFVRIPPKVRLEKPIHLVFYSETHNGAIVSHPRNLILLGEASEATVIESYCGTGRYWTNAVSTIVLQDQATFHHAKLEREGPESFHLQTIQTRLGRGSRFTSHSISLGGRLVRNDLHCLIEEEGGECTLNGLYLKDGHGHVDNQTTIDHRKPHGTSYELYKGIMDGNSRGVFNGKIIVRPDAQKTVARQTNKNLLLSEGAEVNTKPLLEIFANDVKCNHGATIGRLDESQLFYLRSRGIEGKEARALLTAAFAQEIIQKIGIPPLRNNLSRFVFEMIGGGGDA